MRVLAILAITLINCHRPPIDERDDIQIGVPRKVAEPIVAPKPLVPDLPVSSVAVTSPKFTVCFSPYGGCTAEIVRFIGTANKSVRVQAYSFTSKAIGAALIKANSNGVDVQIILDKSDVAAKNSELVDFINAHIPTYIDSKHAIAHNKVIVVDNKAVELGSFNFTDAAEKSNAENLLIIPDADLATEYTKNWDTHRAHATNAAP